MHSASLAFTSEHVECTCHWHNLISHACELHMHHTLHDPCHLHAEGSLSTLQHHAHCPCAYLPACHRPMQTLSNELASYQTEQQAGGNFAGHVAGCACLCLFWGRLSWHVEWIAWGVGQHAAWKGLAHAACEQGHCSAAD